MRAQTRIPQKMPAEYKTKILLFHKFITAARKKSRFELRQIGNMDGVPLTFDIPSNKTVDMEGAKSIAIKTSGHKKTHFTVVLACCADGTQLPPLLISKRKMMPSYKISEGIFVHIDAKGWMDESSMKLWLEKNMGKVSRRPHEKASTFSVRSVQVTHNRGYKKCG
jgi:hypothetical protein